MLLQDDYETLIEAMLAAQLSGLGYPGETTHSGYYLGNATQCAAFKTDLGAICRVRDEQHPIVWPENTRVQIGGQQGLMGTTARTATVLIAYVEEDDVPAVIYNEGISAVQIARGDHSRELQLVCTDPD